MIQVLAGEKGSGKTKRLITMANELVSNLKGHVVYISTNMESIFDLNSSIRLIDVSQFPISSVDSFVGFIYGILSEDYDIECIVVDNLNNILKEDNVSLSKFFELTKNIGENYGIKFIVGVRGSVETLPKLEAEYIAV
ncbi:MAG: twitching motility protein PilT [Caloramator sp.]|nr:twitching motility protein PilT [Caloramator sp.]